MQLTGIKKITGKIRLISGLHIGASNTEMHIGGTDNPVIRNPVTMQPYIPGSSLKGKVRSMLEWQIGSVGDSKGKPLGFKHIANMNGEKAEKSKTILKLFGGSADTGISEELILEIGPTRLSFWDCELNPAWVKRISEQNLLFTETKTENSIDRIKGVAESPRNTERVPAGAVFDFAVSIRIHDGEDILQMLLEGLKLVEITGIGGSVSRGYGKIRFEELCLDTNSIQEKFDAISFN